MKRICDWFKQEEKLTKDEENKIILNQNLLDLRNIYRESRINKFTEKELKSNKFLNSLIKINWLYECKLAANESYIGIYFKNKLISSDLEKFNKFLISIFGENIKIRYCCNISIIWGTIDDEIYEINFGKGFGKYTSLKYINIIENRDNNIGLEI